MKYKYIYGPVPSWRLGRSLGVDLIAAAQKSCSFNCVYCQLGEAIEYNAQRKIYVPTAEIIKEIKSLPPLEIDYITFSGCGEPTLAENLGELTREIKRIRKEKIAILTNASLLGRKDVVQDLLGIDFVMAKLDASAQEYLERINRPVTAVTFSDIIGGLKDFRKVYRGRFALQIMFVAANKAEAERIAALARDIKPDEVQLNTPLRPCAAQPLGREEMAEIKSFFQGLTVVNVYEAKTKETHPLSCEDTALRRGEQ